MVRLDVDPDPDLDHDHDPDPSCKQPHSTVVDMGIVYRQTIIIVVSVYTTLHVGNLLYTWSY